MRKWHRWLSVFLGVFILFVAVTGVLSHAVEIYAEAQPPPKRLLPLEIRTDGTPMPAPAPPPNPARALVRTLHHLHSGETFGPVGVAVSITSGLALIFFAVSGLWMYLDMFRRRARSRGQATRGVRKWFW